MPPMPYGTLIATVACQGLTSLVASYDRQGLLRTHSGGERERERDGIGWDGMENGMLAVDR